jgi:diguanylate cyclase (GGDEF)-like protein
VIASHPRLRRGHVVVAAIWLLGLASLAAVLVLQGRLDQRRQAQLAVANIQLQVGVLPKTALGLAGPTSRSAVQAALEQDEQRITATARSLDRLAGNRTDSRLIIREADALYPILKRANVIASSGHLRVATLMLGLALASGAPGARLNDTFETIGEKYDDEASAARDLAEIGSAVAIVLLLCAFSIVLWRASRLAREKHELLEQSRQDALTDQLTGLWNRRKLFADIDDLLDRTPPVPVLLGILDLDGFKAYNDAFGHPAGDALLARLGQRLAAALAGAGEAYRMGGDEFCVIAQGADAEIVLERARGALAERVDGVEVGCSLGCASIGMDGSTADEVVRAADERLYDEKRSSRAGGETRPSVYAA